MIINKQFWLNEITISSINYIYTPSDHYVQVRFGFFLSLELELSPLAWRELSLERSESSFLRALVALPRF